MDMNIIKQAIELERNWKDHGLRDDVLEDFAFEYLSVLDVEEYDLNQIFTSDAIAAIVKLGIQIIDAELKGKKLIDIKPLKLDYQPPSAKDYTDLFSKWESRGWVAVSERAGIYSVDLNG